MSTPDPARTRRGGWGAWLLVAAVAALLAVVLGGACALLSGALDRTFFVQISTDENGVTTTQYDTEVTFWSRWAYLWWIYPWGSALLGVAALLVALAVLQFARGPAWTLPSRAARRVGAALGAVTVGWGLVCTAIALAAATRDPAQDESGYLASGSVLFDVGHLGVLVLSATALAGLATGALLRPGSAPAPAGPAAGPALAQTDVVVEAEPVSATPAPRAPDVEAPAETASEEPAVLAAFPHPADPALYRRPTA